MVLLIQFSSIIMLSCCLLLGWIEGLRFFFSGLMANGIQNREYFT